MIAATGKWEGLRVMLGECPHCKSKILELLKDVNHDVEVRSSMGRPICRDVYFLTCGICQYHPVFFKKTTEFHPKMGEWSDKPLSMKEYKDMPNCYELLKENEWKSDPDISPWEYRTGYYQNTTPINFRG